MGDVAGPLEVNGRVLDLAVPDHGRGRRAAAHVKQDGAKSALSLIQGNRGNRHWSRHEEVVADSGMLEHGVDVVQVSRRRGHHDPANDQGPGHHCPGIVDFLFAVNHKAAWEKGHGPSVLLLPSLNG